MRVSGIVAVIGERTVIMRRLEKALHRHAMRLIYSRMLDETLQIVPRLYLFNLSRSAPRRSAQEAEADAWLAAIRTLGQRVPKIPVLIVVDGSQRSIIEKALDLGAEDVITESDSRIAAVVWARVRSVLASTGRNTLLSEPASNTGYRAGQDDSISDLRASGWRERPLSDVEAAAVLNRVRRRAAALPTLADRRVPLAEVLSIATPKLRARSGRLDAKRIAARLGVSLRQLAKAAGISHQALSGTPDSKTAQAGLDPIARALGILDELFPTSDQVRAWLNTPHGRLDGSTPLAALLDGRAEQVARMLGGIRDGGVA